MILRTVTGIGVAGIYMPGMKVISQRVGPSGRGRAVSLFVSSFTLGAAASIGLGGGLAEALGWRTALALTSLGPLAGAAIVWLAVRPPLHPLPPPDDLALSAPVDQATGYSLSGVLHNRPALLAMAAYAAHAWETLGLRGWLPAFLAAVLTQSGMDLGEATRTGATVAGIATVAGALGVVSVGALSDRMGRTRTIMIVAGASSACILSLGLIPAAPWASVVVVSLLAAFLVNADSGVISATLTESVPVQILGRVLGVYSFLGFTAGAVAPLAFGAVLDSGAHPTADGTQASGPAWSWAFATLSLSSLLVFAAAAVLHRHMRPQSLKAA
jgi:MFS family permease